MKKIKFKYDISDQIKINAIESASWDKAQHQQTGSYTKSLSE